MEFDDDNLIAEYNIPEAPREFATIVASIEAESTFKGSKGGQIDLHIDGNASKPHMTFDKNEIFTEMYF